jgi:CubicO group peptidase (beta-lactamase class C family)
MMHQNSSWSSVQVTRRRIVQMAGVAPLLASGLFPFLNSQTALAAPSIPATLAPGGELDQYVKQLADQDLFSGTLLVARGEKPVLLRAHGMANKALHIPNGPQTLYATASIVKSFTACAIIQLAQCKKLSFTDPIGKYLSGFRAEIADTVTIHHLLTHTSGLGDFHRSQDYQPGAAIWDSADEVMNGILDIIRKESLQFPPGTASSYSNSGYVVLGAIVAAISKMGYHDYIHQHIFAAAGMTRSRFYTKPQRERMRTIARPYTSDPLNPGSHTDIGEEQGFIGTPAGDAYTTVEDLMRFCQALQTHRLLSPSFTELMIASGYGLVDDQRDGIRMVGGSGSSRGAATTFQMFSELGWNLIILTNYGSSDATVKNLVSKVKELITQA